MNIIQDKRGVSPLIATVLLVMIVVSIGAAVMMVIRGISEEQLENIEISAKEIQCGTDVKPLIVHYSGNYKYCLNTSNATMRIMMENDGKVKIEDWRLTVIGSLDVYDNESVYGELDVRDIKTYIFDFPGNNTIGTIQKIRLLPIVQGSPGQPLVVCKEPHLEWDLEEIDDIPNCPMT